MINRMMDYYLLELKLDLELVLAITDGCAGQYKGKRWYRRIAEFHVKHGVRMCHIYHATAHGKGFHDALGKLIGRLLAQAEDLDQERVATSLQLYDLARGTYHGPVAKPGHGMQAINNYFCCYLTSDKKEFDALQVKREGEDKPFILYIKRSSGVMDCKGFAGSMGTYFVASGGSTNPDHIISRELPCICKNCRKRLLGGLIPAVEHCEECLMMTHMEPFEHKAIVSNRSAYSYYPRPYTTCYSLTTSTLLCHSPPSCLLCRSSQVPRH